MAKSRASDCAVVAFGKLAIFLTNGFATREHHAITALNDPSKLLLENGAKESELKLSFKGDEKASFYKIWVGLDTEGMLSVTESTSANL